MNFTENKAIYLQIAERICDEILSGCYAPDERIPSVREYAGIVEVNANTVMRSYEQLQSQEIIYNKRGIGYFVATEAVKIIQRLRRATFLTSEASYFFKQLHSLNISPEELVEMYQDYIQHQKA